MNTIIDWFTSSGGTIDASAMGLTEFEGQGVGAVALRDIPEGHTLFAIPRSLTLSMRTSELPNLVGIAAWKKFQLHKGWAGLMLCLMWEEAGAKGGAVGNSKGSRWGVYLESLPKKFDTPMFWNEQELAELKGSTLVDKIGKEQAEQDYREKVLPTLLSRPDLFDPSSLHISYSLEKYHITGSRILSRSFGVQPWEEDEDEDEEDHDHDAQIGDAEEIGGEGGEAEAEADVRDGSSMDVDVSTEKPTEGEDVDEDDEEDVDDEDDPANVAMVPMADMLNARYGSENAKLFYEETELRMVTTKPIKASEQIYNTYSDLPNSELLRKYGHVDLIPLPPNSQGDMELGNPADVVDIPAELISEVVTAWYSEKGDKTDVEERIEWWRQEGGEEIFALEHTDPLPAAVLSYTRLLLAPPLEWQKSVEKGKPPKPKLDAATRRAVREVLEKRAGLYATTFEDDSKLLEAQPELSLNRRNAIVVRLGEKRVLREALARIRAEAEKEEKEAEEKAKEKTAGSSKRKNGHEAESRSSASGGRSKRMKK